MASQVVPSEASLDQNVLIGVFLCYQALVSQVVCHVQIAALESLDELRLLLCVHQLYL